MSYFTPDVIAREQLEGIETPSPLPPPPAAPVTYGYRVSHERLPVTPVARDFFLSHMQDWLVLLHYFLVKQKREQYD